jgi:hypothetical protein
MLKCYAINAPIYKATKSKKMFPNGFEGRYKILGDINKFVSIIYYLGKRGYRFNFEEFKMGDTQGFDIIISFGSQRQFTYFKKKFG